MPKPAWRSWKKSDIHIRAPVFAPHPHAGFSSVLAYVIKGSAFVGGEDRRLGTLEAASFAEGDGAVRLRATPSGAQVVLLAGRPLREPVVSYGPFVMNTEQQIAEAFERYRAGGMGTLGPANGT